MKVFTSALQQITTQGYYGPVSFQEYLQANNIPKQHTASKISVDFKEQLDKELLHANTMVLRLGRASNNRHTQFVLARADNINDFFLVDQLIWKTNDNNDPADTNYQSLASPQELYAYKLFPNLTESSLVNLGLASGLLSYALQLDSEKPLNAPATNNSTFPLHCKHIPLFQKHFFIKMGKLKLILCLWKNERVKTVYFLLKLKLVGSPWPNIN